MRSRNVTKILSILLKHSDLLEKYKVKRIGVFGSSIHKDENETNDIDFIAEFDEKNYDNFIGLIFELEKILNKEIDLVTKEGVSKYILPYIKKEVVWYEGR